MESGARGMRERLAARFPLVAAHRGASRLAPENTLCAFRKALALGARAIELDVQLTSDGEVIVLHDRRLERTTNGTGLAVETSFARIRELDAGSWFDPEFADERVPRLEEVLDAVRGLAFVNIELKPGSLDDLGLEARVAAIVRNHGMDNDALVMSFDHVAVMRAKRLAPDLPGLAICGCRLAGELAYLGAMGADGSNHSPDWWTPEAIGEFRAAGMIAHASLVNEPVRWETCRILGLDMVDSDEPAIFGAI